MKLLRFEIPPVLKAVFRFSFFVNKLDISSTIVVGESSGQMHDISEVFLLIEVRHSEVIQDFLSGFEKQVRFLDGSKF